MHIQWCVVSTGKLVHDTKHWQLKTVASCVDLVIQLVPESQL